jgi:hypothetical protein
MKSKLYKALAILTALLLTACGIDISSDTEGYTTPQREKPQSVTARTAEEDTDPEFDREERGEKPDRRDFYTEITGGGEDTVTLMFYLCGSDLESYSGAASADLDEIAAAYPDNPNFNIIIETGGADYWYNENIPSDTNMRFKLEGYDLIPLEEVGRKNMTDPDTVTDFIEFSASEYPADRYIFIMWDHGGGTTGGLMYDEIFYNSPSMMITDLDNALRESGVKFDLIGFDCCLMGTAETAFMVEKHADYMIASQRSEPGTGWYYTDFIEAINDDTSIPTDELGIMIVDSYFDNTPYINELEGDMTLSLLDLTYIDAMFYEMDIFFDTADDTLLADNGFINVSQTLASSKSINDDSQADLLTLIDSMGGSEALKTEADNVIVHSNAVLPGYNGLSLFFPYNDLSLVSEALYIYDEIGISDTYQGFIKTAANIMAGGQVFSGGGSGGPFGNIFEDYSEYDWYDDSYYEEYDELYSETNFDYDELPLEEFDGYYYLALTDEEYELITDYKLWAYLDDGEGYVELGADALYEFDDYGDLIVDYDYTWVALNDQIVPFYTIEDTAEYNYGYVPCEIDGEYAEIILLWNEENPGGIVAGWRYETYGAATMKGLFDLEDGLEICFYCYYYPYDSDEWEIYPVGDIITVDGELTVSYDDINDYEYGEIEVYYEVIDIYQNSYFTESLYFAY